MISPTRRQLLGILGAGAALPMVQQSASAETVATNAWIVIIGAGAAGTSLANRLSRRLEGARITLVDPRKAHLYQPGLSLVAAGLKDPGYVVSETTDWLPDGAELIQEAAAEIDPIANTVTTQAGTRLDYDFLIVAPGLVLDHGAIEGFSLDMVGEKPSIAS